MPAAPKKPSRRASAPTPDADAAAEKAEADRREYYRKYHAENKLRRNQQRALHYQDNLRVEREKSEKRNRKAGHAPRPKGWKSRPQLFVNLSRKFRFFPHPETGETLIYFSSKKGFTAAELREILKLHREAKAAALELDTPES